MILRDYQLDAVTAARRAYAEGVRHVLLVGPTGMGKGVIIAWVVEQHLARPDTRALVVVHRSVLVEDLAQRIAGRGLDPDRYRVESVQGLLAAAKAGRPLPSASLLIFDEAHHYVADDWRAVLGHYPEALVLGLTATPVRSDRRPLSPPFERMIVVAQTHELQSRGVLVECDVLSPVRPVRGLASHPLDAYRKHASGRRAVVFCQDVGHAHEIAGEFTAAGIPASAIEGGTSDKDRSDILARFRAGEVRVLTNVFLLTEGFDDPGIEVCILARGCDHVGAYLQMVGRVLRASPSTGKTRALLIDLKGIVRQHGMPSDPREFSLEGQPIRSVSALPVLAQCKPCGAVYRFGPPVCPRCGAKAPPPPRPRITPAELQAVRSVEPIEQKRATYRRIVARAKSRGQAAHIFKGIYGFWPSREVMSS